MVTISVIMPVYNDEEFLSDALDSILKQTLNNIEIICVNDGSTDKSLKILNDYADKYDFIKVFSKENEGSGIARNFALTKTSGEYIAYLDSDDVYLDKNALKLMYEKAIETDADMVSGNLMGINTDGKLEFNRNLERFQSEGFIEPEEYGIPYSYYKNIFKKSFLSENNIVFPDLLRGQDPVFLAEILTKVDKIPTVPVDLYGFKYSPQSDLLKMNTYRKRYDYIKHFKDTYDILENAGFYKMKKNYEKKLKDFIKAFHNCYTKEVKDIVLDVFSDDEHILRIVKPMFIKPKVSVIIHSNEFSPDCLKVVLTQSLKEIEVICIYDNSAEILKDLSLKDSRIRIFNQNEFNLKEAESDYIYFFNICDDIDKHALKKSYRTIKQNNTDLLVFKSDSFNRNGIVNKSFYNYDKYLDDKSYDNFTYKDIGSGIFCEGYFKESKLYKKDLIERFDDILLHLSTFQKADKISFINEVLYHKNIETTNQVDLETFTILDNETLAREYEKEYNIFKVSEIVKNCNDENYVRSTDTVKNIDRSYLADNEYLLSCYNLLLSSNSFEEFKRGLNHLTFENEVNNYKKMIHELRIENSKLKDNKKRLEKINEEILNSTSWKVTKPFRKLKHRNNH